MVRQWKKKVKHLKETSHNYFNNFLYFKHKLPYADGMQSSVSLLTCALRNPHIRPFLPECFNIVGKYATSQGIVLYSKGLGDGLRPRWGLDWHNVVIQRGQGSGSHPAWSSAARRAHSSKALVHNAAQTLAWKDQGDERLQISNFQCNINQYTKGEKKRIQ